MAAHVGNRDQNHLIRSASVPQMHPAPAATKVRILQPLKMQTVTIRVFNEREFDDKARTDQILEKHEESLLRSASKKKLVMQKPPKNSKIYLKPLNPSFEARTANSVGSPYSLKISRVREELEATLKRQNPKKRVHTLKALPKVPSVKELAELRSRGTTPCFWDKFAMNPDLLDHLARTIAEAK